MPGFWKTLKRLTAGEPVYQTGSDTATAKDDKADSTNNDGQLNGAPQQELPPAPEVPVWRQHPRSGPKVYPEVVVHILECRLQDYDMEVTVHLQNNALERVLLDKMLFMNQPHELDHWLEPGQRREFMIYEGPMPTNQFYDRAEVHYRDETGDYFSAIHHVDFKPEHDGHYSVERMKFLPPVKDI